MTATAITEPTFEEQVRALKETAARLAAERDNALAERADLLEANGRLQAERDCAMKMASQATKDQDRERREFEGRLKVRDALIESLRIAEASKSTDLRRSNARNRELAVENEELRKQRDRDQREPPAVHISWWSRRIGNQF